MALFMFRLRLFQAVENEGSEEANARVSRRYAPKEIPLGDVGTTMGHD